MPAVGLAVSPPPPPPRHRTTMSSAGMMLDPRPLNSHVHSSRRQPDVKMARRRDEPPQDLIWEDERFNTLKSSKPRNYQQTPSSPSSSSSSSLLSGYQQSAGGNYIRLGNSYAPTSTTTTSSTVTARSNGMKYGEGNGGNGGGSVSSGSLPAGSLINGVYHRHSPKPAAVVTPPQPPRSLDLRNNGYNDISAQKLSHSYHSGYQDRTRIPASSSDYSNQQRLASKHLSYSYDSTLITRALEANRSPDSSANSTPVKSPLRNDNTRPSSLFPRSQTSQDLQVHHARQVFIRSQSVDPSIYQQNSSPLISPVSSKSVEIERHSPPSTPPTPSSSYSDPALTSSSLKKQGTLKQNLRTISENINSFFRPLKASGKAKSEGDLLKRSRSTPDGLDKTNDDDDDDEETESDDHDDYGFLSYPSFRSLHHSFNHARSASSSASAMQKSSVMASSGATASPGSKLLPRRWRSKSKVPNKGSAAWKPEGPCAWSCIGGRKVTLTPICITTLTEAERVILQKLALAKLQAMELGCTISVPKDASKQRSKSRGFTLKRRTVSGTLLDSLGGKEPVGSGWVFGIPLAKCIANDAELHRCRTTMASERRTSNEDGTRTNRKSSSSSGAISSESLSENDTTTVSAAPLTPSSHHRKPSHSLLDALSLSSSAQLGAASAAAAAASSSSSRHLHGVQAHTPRIPYVARACFRHLLTYGIQTLGIFRIGSSKKRIKQLRDEFDSGRAVRLTEDHSPHDVGGLLKEFFRDLPDPLLTRDLYTAFVATRKLKDEVCRLRALHLLISLLPAANRDMLAALLDFLNVVVAHSTDTLGANGETLSGNKMDAHNLATLFGPNIMHKSKRCGAGSGGGGGTIPDFQVESMERAEERGDVISVVQDMIQHHTQLLQMSGEEHDEVLRRLQETDFEAVDILLKTKSANLRLELDAETSSSFYEESDTSSIPHTPSSLPDCPPSHPRTLAEALAHNTPKSTLRTSMSDTGGASSSTDGDDGTLKAQTNNYRLSAPDPSWYTSTGGGGRSLSPASPRVSPAPKALKGAQVPDLHIHVPSESPERGLTTNSSSAITQAKLLLTPRTARSQRIGGGAPTTTTGHSLTVPLLHTPRTDHAKSNSSLSSGYNAGSSRSGTASPSTEAMMNARSQWFLDTPPSTPTGVPLHTVFDFPHDASHTSPSSRPVSGVEGSCGDWQKERWKHWERIAKEHSDDFHEQETLV